jgi:hypothetical protein
MFDIFNKSGLDLGPLEDLMQEFMPFAQERHGFKNPPKLFLLGDEENAANPLGKTGGYNPGSMEVTIYVSGRHPKDVLRSLSHELVHHNQNERGDLSGASSTALGYAQEDPHMREMEREAYEQGNLCFRDWEDGRKKQLQESIYYETIIGGDEMSEKAPLKEWKDSEINTRLMEKFGLLKEEGTAGDDIVINDKDATKEKDGDEELSEEEDEDEDISGLEEKSVNDTLSRLNEEVSHLLNEQSTLGHFWNWATQGYRKDPVQAAMERTGASTMSAKPTGETRQKEVQYFTRENEAGGEDVLADPRAIFDDGGNLAPGVNVRYETKDVPVYQPAGESARREMGIVPRGTEAKSTEFSNPVSRTWYGMGDKGGWMDPSHAAWSATGFGEMIDPGGVYAQGPAHKINQMVSAGEHKQQATDELDRDLMYTADLLSTALPLGPTGYAKASRFNPNVRNIRQFGKRQPVKPPGMSQRRWERLLKQSPERAARSPFTKGDYSLKNRMQEPIPRRASDYYDPRLDPAIQPVPRFLDSPPGRATQVGPPPLPGTSGGGFGVRSPRAVRIPGARTEPPPIPGTPGQLDDIINRFAQFRPERRAGVGPTSGGKPAPDDWWNAELNQILDDPVVPGRLSNPITTLRNYFSRRRQEPGLIAPGRAGPDGSPIYNPDIDNFAVSKAELKKLFPKNHADIDADPYIFAQHLHDQLNIPGAWRSAQVADMPVATHPSLLNINRPIGSRMRDRALGPNRLTGEIEYFPYANPSDRLFGGSGVRRPFTGYGMSPFKWGLPGTTAAGLAYLNPEEAALPYVDERGELASKQMYPIKRPFSPSGTPLFPWEQGLGDPMLGRPGSPSPFIQGESRIWDEDQIYDMLLSPTGQFAESEDGEVVAIQATPDAPFVDVRTGRELAPDELDKLVFTGSTYWDEWEGDPYKGVTPPTGWTPQDPETPKTLQGYLEERGITLQQYLGEIEAGRRNIEKQADYDQSELRQDDGVTPLRNLMPPDGSEGARKRNDEFPYTWDDLNESYYNTLFEGIKELWTKETKE